MNMCKMAAVIAFPQSHCKSPNFLHPSTSSFLGSAHSLQYSRTLSWEFKSYKEARLSRKRTGIVCGLPFPVDPWAPSIDSQSIATQLFGLSLFPYIGFLYFITKSKTSTKLTLFGFYFLLAFVGATTKVHYGTSLSNVDWLHGGAESLLSLSNLFILLGLRDGLRKAGNSEPNASTPNSGLKEENKDRMQV